MTNISRRSRAKATELRASHWLATLAAFSLSSAAIAQGATAQPMARTQFIAEMDSQFHAIDADKNGQLTRSEIEQFEVWKAALHPIVQASPQP